MNVWINTLLALSVIISTPALAIVDIKTNSANSSDWQARSQATATWMWFDIYNATLFTKPEFNQSRLLADDEPLKLQLCYLKSIGRGDLIKGAEAVLDKNLSTDLKTAVDALHKNYVDVEPGDCYVLEYAPQTGTQLKLNGKLAFESKMPGFKSVYFGIWLGQNALSDTLKNTLLEPLNNTLKESLKKE